MSTYTAKHREYYLKNKDKIKKTSKAFAQVWLLLPEGQYSVQKRKAKQRGIEWKLTFEEWWDIWQSSGKWYLRGDRKGTYCMCRNKDIGPYSKDNVRIDLFENNSKENYSLIGIDDLGRFKSK